MPFSEKRPTKWEQHVYSATPNSTTWLLKKCVCMYTASKRGECFSKKTYKVDSTCRTHTFLETCVRIFNESKREVLFRKETYKVDSLCRTHTILQEPFNMYEYTIGAQEERWGAGVETQKNVRGEVGGWGRVPLNEPYAPLLSTIYDGA